MFDWLVRLCSLRALRAEIRRREVEMAEGLSIFKTPAIKNKDEFRREIEALWNGTEKTIVPDESWRVALASQPIPATPLPVPQSCWTGADPGNKQPTYIFGYDPSYTCGKCLQQGHLASVCPNPEVTSDEPEPEVELGLLDHAPIFQPDEKEPNDSPSH